MKRSDFINSVSLLSSSLLVLPKVITSTVQAIKEKLNPKIVRSNEGKTINVLGDVQTIKLTGKDTNGLFTLIEEENVPGTGIPLHVHENEDEVFKVIE